MARRTRKGWSYLSGEKGRNRVRIFERPGGSLTLEFRDDGERKRIALGHSDREKAKRKADEVAAKLARAESVIEEAPPELTLQELFDIYLGEVTPRNGERHQQYDRKAADMFVRYFGPDRRATTLNRRDWDGFIRDRGSGRIGPRPGQWEPVATRTVQKDLSYLRSVLTWATMAGDGHGGVLLERDPLKGYRLPKEKNPRRITLTAHEYSVLLGVAGEVDWRFRVALILAHETGHRIGAIRVLRWSDLDFEGASIHWRAESEKTGYAHVTPMTEDARVAFEEARVHGPGIGDSPVLPAPKDPARPVGRYLLRNWWRRAEVRAGLERKPGRGWHSLRRKFATDLHEEPLSVVCQLGGWRDIETVIKCYQRPDEDKLRGALERRKECQNGARKGTRKGTSPTFGTNAKPRLML